MKPVSVQLSEGKAGEGQDCGKTERLQVLDDTYELLNQLALELKLPNDCESVLLEGKCVLTYYYISWKVFIIFFNCMIYY